MVRFGCTADFQRAYSTMDVSCMESVWNVFKQLFDKRLIQQRRQVQPYSIPLHTVVSGQESHWNVQEESRQGALVAFPLIRDPNIKLLVQTTCLWSLPANIALFVNPDAGYLHIRLHSTQEIFITTQETLKFLPNNFEVVKRQYGSYLDGEQYTAPFDFY